MTASFENILKRLEKRGEKIEPGEDNWTIRKAKLCMESHADECFGETINTNGKNAAAVADEILAKLGNQA